MSQQLYKNRKVTNSPFFKFFTYLLICSGLNSAFVDDHSEREEAKVVGGMVS